MEKLDRQHWFARWEAMQNCYVPHRLYRFDLMLKLADLSREGEAHILDLGCGPGALSFCALRHYPKARIVAADFDPVMLAIGRGVAETDRVQFVRVDLRQAGWWEPYEETFDLIVSSTMLHWLSEGNIKRLYAHIYRALKPGGQFFNSDHMASNDPAIQAHYRKLLHVNQQSAFHVVGADDWESFWRELEQAAGEKLDRSEEELWEGTDNGLPRQFHVETLRASGFEQVAFHWQDMGEAVIGARKPYR
ncbi:MAG: class I SAM-dependent methyltransferase [Anaerolineae bacterium]|nr:class I SAM-dependent methyltransferase [Anaerolineae bacterium]